jgi:hypothetical protein
MAGVPRPWPFESAEGTFWVSPEKSKPCARALYQSEAVPPPAAMAERFKSANV